MRLVISLVTSATTLYGMWLAGSNKWTGWLVGLCNQALWLAFIVAFQAWGLLPLSVALIVVYSRNLRRWRQSLCSRCRRPLLPDQPHMWINDGPCMEGPTARFGLGVCAVNG